MKKLNVAMLISKLAYNTAVASADTASVAGFNQPKMPAAVAKLSK